MSKDNESVRDQLLNQPDPIGALRKAGPTPRQIGEAFKAALKATYADGRPNHKVRLQAAAEWSRIMGWRRPEALEVHGEMSAAIALVDERRRERTGDGLARVIRLVGPPDSAPEASQAPSGEDQPAGGYLT